MRTLKENDDSVRELKTQKKIRCWKSVSIFFSFMFKFNNNLLPDNFQNYYKSVKNVHNYHTRSSETIFFLPRFNSKIGHKLLSYQGSNLRIYFKVVDTATIIF